MKHPRVSYFLGFHPFPPSFSSSSMSYVVVQPFLAQPLTIFLPSSFHLCPSSLFLLGWIDREKLKVEVRRRKAWMGGDRRGDQAVWCEWIDRCTEKGHQLLHTLIGCPNLLNISLPIYLLFVFFIFKTNAPIFLKCHWSMAAY